MTAEVRYIIENKRFKRTREDYAIYWELLIPIGIFAVGLNQLIKGLEFNDYLRGTLLILVSISLTKFVLHRLSQLNQFEELNNKRTKEENFEHCLDKLKNLNIVDIDKDVHNLAINAKYKGTFILPIYEWLTIVCLDNKVLVNSRPAPTTLLFWFRRNTMIDFRKYAVNVPAANNMYK